LFETNIEQEVDISTS